MMSCSIEIDLNNLWENEHVLLSKCCCWMVESKKNNTETKHASDLWVGVKFSSSTTTTTKAAATHPKLNEIWF